MRPDLRLWMMIETRPDQRPRGDAHSWSQAWVRGETLMCPLWAWEALPRLLHTWEGGVFHVLA